MEFLPLMLAYTAAALVALGVMMSFSSSIDQTLSGLLPDQVAPPWSRFVKFAVFAAAFSGGLPSPTAVFIDRGGMPPPPPGMGDGLMLVMGSASGALMASAWILLLFFGGTLTALIAGRAYAALRKHREQEAREFAERLERSESRGEPLRRKEPAEPRPVAQEKSAPHPPQPR